MAVPNYMTWEIRANGDPDNGGGYYERNDGGVDYSQQDTAEVDATDIDIDGVTNTIIRRSGATPFNANHVDNIINITAGTGFTVGRYRVVSESGGDLTLDRAVGTAGSTGGSGKLGGAVTIMASDALFWEALTVGSKIWLKADGTHTLTASISVSRDGSNAAAPIVFSGYNTTRGDAMGDQSNRPTISLGVYGIFFDNDWEINNIDAAGTGSTNLDIDARGRAYNVKSINTGVTANRQALNMAGSIDGDCIDCETSSTLGYALTMDDSMLVRDSYFRDSTYGIWNAAGPYSRIVDCVIDSCTTTGIRIGIDHVLIKDCTIYNCGTGIDRLSTANALKVQNLIIDNCTTGIGGAADANDVSFYDTINFSNNTTDYVAGIVVTNETSLDPQFEDAAGGDFRIGDNLKDTGFPQALGTLVTNKTMGGVEYRGAAGGGGTVKASTGLQVLEGGFVA